MIKDVNSENSTGLQNIVYDSFGIGSIGKLGDADGTNSRIEKIISITSQNISTT